MEEKRGVMEDQLARLLYNVEPRPRLLGKYDVSGAALIPAVGELAPAVVAEAIRTWLTRQGIELPALRAASGPTAAAGELIRLPSFCSGCPHNRSTLVPEGSVAGGGIGCHAMAMGMARNTQGITHMGGEGVQ